MTKTQIISPLPPVFPSLTTPCSSTHCSLVLLFQRHHSSTTFTEELLQDLQSINETLLETVLLLPESPYRTNVSIVARHRLQVLQDANGNATQVEQQCQRGTLPELVQQGQEALMEVKKRI